MLRRRHSLRGLSYAKIPSSFALLPLALALNSAFAADIEPALVAQANAQARVDALIVFADQSQPLLAPMDAKADYRARRRVLVDALRARAQMQQADVRAWLDARGIAYRPYWIANTIAAQLSASDLQGLAARADIARVAANPRLSARLPQPAFGPAAPQAVESIAWGGQQDPRAERLGCRRIPARASSLPVRTPLSMGSPGAAAAVPRLGWNDGRPQSQLARCDPRFGRQQLRQRQRRTVRRLRSRHAYRRYVCRRRWRHASDRRGRPERAGSAAATWMAVSARRRATSSACNGCSRRPILPARIPIPILRRTSSTTPGMPDRRRLHGRRRDRSGGRQRRCRRYLLRRRRGERRPGLQHDHRTGRRSTIPVSSSAPPTAAIIWPASPAAGRSSA